MPTELPPTYDFKDSADRWSKAWDEAGVFKSDPSRPGEAFSIVIPPPNITGSLHMGHALNNTIQDILVRYKRMDGYNVLWVPGTDHAGIATQWVVRRQLAAEGIFFRDLGREEFVKRVWTWKGQSGGMITHQLRRLGASMDWSHEAFTMSPELSRAVTEHFVRLYEDGLIYRGERLINWDPDDQTALSDLEVENKEVQGELFEFAYKLTNGQGEIVVATTRPETMLGDTAIAVHPDDERYKHLIGETVDHPFVGRKIPIIGDAILVDPAFGTGAVKVTPAHDFNDFATGKRHDLPMINILETDGRINQEGGRFAGLDRVEARLQVKAELEALGLARGTKPHVLQLPHSQRSGAVVEPMLSTQWFVRMKPLVRPAIAAVEYGQTRFVPESWENTYFAWMRNIQDWCISRQLWWGHRIPAWHCQDCKQTIVARTAPEACGCGSTRLQQDEDVLDTWFSSALWPFATLGWPEKTADLDRYYPTTVLVTAFDIIFFWVARMMVAGTHLTGTVPFKDVYIHALVLDEHGDKMSKTKGNVVDPLTVIDAFGSDAFRFTLAAMAAQGRDVKWNVKRCEDFHRFETKIWSALRFCFLTGDGYDPKAPIEFGPYERWIQVRAGQAVARVRDALDAYKFNDAASEIYSFVWSEFCDWYIELSKSVLYDEDAPPARRNGTRHALFSTMGLVARLLHPFMPFLSEEIWSRLPGTSGFVATAAYPRPADFPADDGVLAEVASVQEMIVEVRRIRADMELSGKNAMTARIADDALLQTLSAHGRALQDLARLSVERLDSRPKGYATATVRGIEAVIPLEGLVDFAEEIKRLEKVLSKVDKDVSDLERRLGNADFVAKGKPEVVEDMRSKLAIAKARQAALRGSQQRLQAAL